MTNSDILSQVTFQVNNELMERITKIIHTDRYGSISGFFRFWTSELIPLFKSVFTKKTKSGMRSVNIKVEDKEDLTTLSENTGMSRSDFMRIIGLLGIVSNNPAQFGNAVMEKKSEKELPVDQPIRLD